MAVFVTLSALRGERVAASAADVADEASIAAAVQKTVAEFGRLDILVNNAAIFTMVERKTFDEIPQDEWDRVMAVNVRGVWLAAKAAVPEMRKNGYGKIINISSGRAFKGSTHFLHYDASKAAVLGITKSLARELGADNICVNALAPGSTASENVMKRSTDLGSSMAGTVNSRALKRCIEARHWGAASGQWGRRPAWRLNREQGLIFRRFRITNRAADHGPYDPIV